MFPNSSNAYDKFLDIWSTDLAQFESKTRQDYAWREGKLVGAVNYEVDIHDKGTWCAGTIFEVKEKTVSPGRVILLGYCAFRVYREKTNSVKRDERGVFEGWSSKFDEWIPLFCPRIAPWQSKVGQVGEDDIDLEDDIDEKLEPEPGMDRVYAVPRINKCISSAYLHQMNFFGSEGGFKMVLDVLENGQVDDQG